MSKRSQNNILNYFSSTSTQNCKKQKLYDDQSVVFKEVLKPTNTSSSSELVLSNILETNQPSNTKNLINPNFDETQDISFYIGKRVSSFTFFCMHSE